ncbi:LacI family DNA-binding transcriptional regulator [Allorhizobium borbori]|uniref:LacI family gluconate utilization system Gnt-I transcriptional repressor n=1 Tax=Allorhizobium borbori TaxID=485907 RepID=A0A7W6K8G3_9HYPH|nr:LacI family DNA-binding transcriptional regulator [Allorhizobium borbori]MBB4105962.1 LacI family gluconate utilization system Gnt-I transcriptional repressor [Allorhizobium borbori]
MKKAKGTIRMSDVARVLGVSPMTVSNSFRNPHLVTDATRQKVIETATKLGYVPNTIAGNLVSGQSKVIAVMTPSIRHSSFADMIDALEQSLAKEGYSLIMSLVETREREVEALRALIGRRVDGVVIAGELQDATARELVVKSGTPVVETWHLHENMTDMSAGFSEHDAAADAVRFMIEAGRRRIGMIGYHPSTNRRLIERINGFRTAMNEAGGNSANVVLMDASINGYEAGAKGILQLIDVLPEIDGVFCMTDILAVGAMFESTRLGWPVPGRLAIMGYGDYDIAAQIPPGLTTIHTPGVEIGVESASLLLDRLAQKPGIAHQRRVAYRLVSRGSV